MQFSTVLGQVADIRIIINIIIIFSTLYSSILESQALQDIIYSLT